MATNDLLVGYTRRFSGPVDATTTFPTLSALQSYASNDPTAYAGQVCAVTGTNTVYVINTNKTVSAVGTVSGGGGGTSYDQSLNTTDSVKFINATIGQTGVLTENNNNLLEFFIGNKPNQYGFNTAGIFSSGISFYYNCDAQQAIIEYDPYSSGALKFPQTICGGTSSLNGNWQINPNGSASFANGAASIDSLGNLTAANFTGGGGGGMQLILEASFSGYNYTSYTVANNFPTVCQYDTITDPNSIFTYVDGSQADITFPSTGMYMFIVTEGWVASGYTNTRPAWMDLRVTGNYPYSSPKILGYMGIAPVIDPSTTGDSQSGNFGVISGTVIYNFTQGETWRVGVNVGCDSGVPESYYCDGNSVNIGPFHKLQVYKIG